MARDLVSRAVDAVGIARLGAHVDRAFEQPIDGLHIGGFGLADADLTEIEYRDLQSDIEAAHKIPFVRSLFQLIGIATVENVDEPSRLGKSVGLCKQVELDTGNLQIDAPRDRIHLDPSPSLNPTRHCWQRIGKLEVEIGAPEAQRANEGLA